MALTLAVTTTGPADARRLARALVEEGLAACATVIPGAWSVYRWRGAIEETDEHVILLKTTRGRTARLRRRLGELHAYEVPEDLVLTARASPAYERWVADSTRSRTRAR